MLRYETLILAHPEITGDEINQLERYFSTHLSDHKGQVDAFDQWGKMRLSFPIKKNDYGAYILVRYQAAPEFASSFMKELENFFRIKCSEFVLRSVTIKLAADAPTTYEKPETNESARSASVESFLKDNKMDGLLSSVSIEEEDSIDEDDMEA